MNKSTYLLSASGIHIDVLKPRPEDINLHDIALGLARQRRFSGHTKQPYNVAQHSCMAEQTIGHPAGADMVRRAVLLHDASEAYIGDVIHPLKVHLPDYQAIENRWMDAICERFNLPSSDAYIRGTVKWADRACLRAEVYYLCENPSYYGYGPTFKKDTQLILKEYPSLKGIKTPWTEHYSATQFLRQAQSLSLK